MHLTQLTLIAIIGIVLGFAFMATGFFLDVPQAGKARGQRQKARQAKPIKKRIALRKAA